MDCRDPWLLAHRNFHSCRRPPFLRFKLATVVAPDALPVMLGLHVEAGKTYFVRARLARFYKEGVAVFDLTQINEDEGRYLVSMSKRSLFTKKATP